jgi:hypothetical protein
MGLLTEVMMPSICLNFGVVSDPLSLVTIFEVKDESARFLAGEQFHLCWFGGLKGDASVGGPIGRRMANFRGGYQRCVAAA